MVLPLPQKFDTLFSVGIETTYRELILQFLTQYFKNVCYCLYHLI
jgi:hypothetical protein